MNKPVFFISLGWKLMRVNELGEHVRVGISYKVLQGRRERPKSVWHLVVYIPALTPLTASFVTSRLWNW